MGRTSARAAIVAGALLSGCGRLDFDPQSGPPSGDAAASGDAGADALVDAGPLVCPASYGHTVGGSPGPQSHHYGAHVASDWLTAEAACAADGPGAHLVSIDDPNEVELVAFVPGGKSWIGLSDRVTEGTFITVTNQTPVTHWTAGSPHAGGPDCVSFDETTGGMQTDEDCATSYPAICECDGVAPDPTAF